METQKTENKQIEKDQTIVLNNRSEISVTGTQKIISLKPDLIQLDTNHGGLLILGDKLELIKLDNGSSKAEIKGTINSLKFIEAKSKESFFRKIFK